METKLIESIELLVRMNVVDKVGNGWPLNISLLLDPQINHLVYTTRWKHMMKVGFKCGCVLRS